MSGSRKASTAPGSPSETPEEVGGPPEGERPHLQSPTIQEPEEPPEGRPAASARRTSLVIVESADDQPPACDRLDEDAAFQKVRSAVPSPARRGRGPLPVPIPPRLVLSLHDRKVCQINELGPSELNSFKI